MLQKVGSGHSKALPFVK